MMISKRTFISAVTLVAVALLTNCGKDNGNNSDNGRDNEGEGDNIIEVRVGTRTVQTDKVTSKGIPVVPMWEARMARGDIRSGAGFPILNDAEHAEVWIPSSLDEGAYNHYACLIHHKGKFYAMWGNHEFGEDAPGQRVLYATSETWGEWTDMQELFPAPGPVLPRSEDGIHLKPDRWAVIDDELYAMTYVYGAGSYMIARSVSESGELGEPFLMEDLPTNGELPVYMQGPDAPQNASSIGTRLRNWYRENDHISYGALSSWGVPRTGPDGQRLIEPFIYRAKDDRLVLMLRAWGTPGNPIQNNRIYVSFNNGTNSWGTPYPTDIPDSPTRTEAVTLEDGTILLIGSQNVSVYDRALYLDRDPITISVSKDGYTFTDVYALRTNSPTSYRFSGVGGRNRGYAYSQSIVHEGWLYTLYSVGKEHMEITRVPLSALDL